MMMTALIAKFILKRFLKKILLGGTLGSGEINAARTAVDTLGDGDGVFEFQDVIDALKDLITDLIF